ncbi:hypothetical protein HS5_16860 [Acidianus sp. HS-5]|nr:hypothetical protein HS5_16860 [Acidianus sp. HS-5]
MAFIVTVISAISIWWVGLIIGMSSLFFYYSLKRVKLILSFSSLQMVVSVLNYSFFVSPTILEEIFGNNLTVIWKFPSYFIYMGVVPCLTLQAIIYSFQVSMRIWSLFMFSGLIFLATTPSQIIRSFHKLKVPMPITFAVTVALVSLPRIFDSADTIMKLQLMKGIGYKKRIKFPYTLRALMESVVPLFIYEFKKAKTVSVSAETRAFMAYKTRTYIEDVIFSTIDKSVIALMMILLVVDIYFVSIGLIPSIPFHP